MVRHSSARVARFAMISAAAVMIAGAAMPASASDPSTNGTTTQPDNNSPKAKPHEQQYCQMVDVTGSRMPHKVCKSRKEWIEETGVDPETLRR